MDEWNTVIRTNGGAVQDYTISYQNLDPSRTYYFRVLAYNEFGISEPCTTDKTVRDEVFDKISPGEIEISAKLHRNLKKIIKVWIKLLCGGSNIQRTDYCYYSRRPNELSTISCKILSEFRKQKLSSPVANVWL